MPAADFAFHSFALAEKLRMQRDIPGDAMHGEVTQNIRCIFSRLLHAFAFEIDFGKFGRVEKIITF